MARRAPAAWETRRPLLPELALVAATAAYGSTFKLVQNALLDITPLGYMVLRFGVAALALAPFAFASGWRNREPDAPRTTDDFATFLRIGIAFGVIGFVGYWFQNVGLQHTTTSDSAFITGLFVVFTPIIETIVRRRRPARFVTIAVVVSLVGLFLLTGARFDIGYGNALTLGCAADFGLWIYVGGQLANRFDPIALTCVQLVVMSVLSLPFVLATGFGHASGRVWLAVLVTGVVCSAAAFTVQLWGQRRIEPARAAVILLFEPVVAGFVGYAVGERLGVKGYIGAVVILASILVAEAPSWISSARAASAG
ncbi:MAG TPA: DMT family transporter [Acidimicrobiia bacterium]|nr:DMT family transporter [Gaiellaceae bacterium]HEX4490764.1 DMT family transporter [Acidimicrobiia bacterium]